MAVVSKSYLLEAGVHFGHQTKRWNPKMKEFIFTSRDDIYIIDLQKTVDKLEEAYAELLKVCENGGKALFVGTKKQAQEACIEEATRCGGYYMTTKWLGGTLTNFKTIRERINRIEDIENMTKDGKLELLPKKERIKINKEYDKLNKILCGIREMKKLPQAVIIVDPRIEMNAIREAKRLNIPVFGIVDTNSDPDVVDYVIPGNDDAVRSVKVLLGVLANAVCEANNLPLEDYITEEGLLKEKEMDEFLKEDIIKDDKIVRRAHKEIIKDKEISKKPYKEKNNKKIEIKKSKTDYSSLKLVELKTLAKEKGIKGYSSMKKDELIKELND